MELGTRLGFVCLVETKMLLSSRKDIYENSLLKLQFNFLLLAANET